MERSENMGKLSFFPVWEIICIRSSSSLQTFPVPGDIETLVFGVVASILAGIAIYVTRAARRTTVPEGSDH